MNVYPFDQAQEDLGYSFPAQYLFKYAEDLGAKTVILEDYKISFRWNTDYR